jgi:hypothetical protein
VDRKSFADALVRATLSLGDGELRARYLVSIVRSWPTDALAQALDAVCEGAEQAEAEPREALVAIVDALNAGEVEDVLRRLREEAAGESLLALGRLLRPPPHSSRPASGAPAADVREDVRRGRAVPLGERKSLARRPDRDTLQRMLRDPHPDVIQRCLRNPRLVEDDVVRLAAKRPGRADVLLEIARSSWVRRPRVRMALVLNPATSPEVVNRLLGLLLRTELATAARSPSVPAAVRALCLEHLERRPPVEEPEPPPPELQ